MMGGRCKWWLCLPTLKICDKGNFHALTLGTCHARIIDTNITSGHEAQQAVNEGTTNGLRQCCRDAIACSVFEQEFETAAEEGD